MDLLQLLSSEDQLALVRMLADALQNDSGVISDELVHSVESSACIPFPHFGAMETCESTFVEVASPVSDQSVLGASPNSTTIMIRNIPRRCTQRMLMSDVITSGFGECIDFCYLPTDISTGRNLGYAFLNFLSPPYARAFKEYFHKKHLSSIKGSRAGLSVTFAVIQGLEANIENMLKNASVHRIKNPEYLPLISLNGQLIPCSLKSPQVH